MDYIKGKRRGRGFPKTGRGRLVLPGKKKMVKAVEKGRHGCCLREGGKGGK